MLILSRSGQGVGGAIMFATSLALLGNSFRGKDRGVAFGVWGAITGVSTALGPVLGGVITTNWSWRGIFLVNVPIGVLAVALTALAGGGVQVAAPDAAGLGRVRAAHDRPGEPGLRADPGGREQLVGHGRHHLPGGRRRGAGRVHRGRAARRAPDVRPVPAAHADLRRRLHRRVRHERLAVRRAALAGPLPAGHPGLLGAGRRACGWPSSAAPSSSPRRSPGGSASACPPAG